MGVHYRTPREDLFAQLGVLPVVGQASRLPQRAARPRWTVQREMLVTGGMPALTTVQPCMAVGKGCVIWMHENPAEIAQSAEGDARLVATVKQAAAYAGLKWRETNYLLLRRGPYLLASGLDESIAGAPKTMRGRFVNLFDPELRAQKAVTLTPASRYFLLDLDAAQGRQPGVLASACKALSTKQDARSLSIAVEGVVNTPAVVLLRSPTAPRSVKLAGQPLENFQYDPEGRLLWIRFANEAKPRELAVDY